MPSTNQALNLWTQPLAVFADLAETQDLKPGLASLAVTSVLFAATSVVSHVLKLPMSAEPPIGLAAYRLVQAAAMPAILFAGCLLSVGVSLVLGRWFRGRSDVRRLMAVSLPALLVPLWPMLWPTEMATSLGLLDAAATGFPGLWVRELAPAFTVLYMLFLLWMALWQAQRVYLREGFALAVFSLLPALGLWAVVLR